ncbi:MAG: hypothetical protein IGR93_12135 [Hydrococcus sp. C42_A2020_068]|nr:hypothetical protein [Hydrococcus sp. C42_A2020_068]
MSIQQDSLKRARSLIKITLLTYFIFPCYQTLGASLSFGFKSSLLFGSLLKVENSLEGDRETWESMVEEIVNLTTQVDQVDLIIDNFYASNRSQDNEAQKSLSVSSLIEAFRQLNLEGTKSTSQPASVPILPQVKYADIDKGIYAFESSSQLQKRPTNSVFFNANNQTAFPKPLGSQVLSIRQLSMPMLDSELALMPKNDLSASLEQMNVNPAVADVAKTINSFGAINVNNGFRMLPRESVLTSRQFNYNFLKTSTFLGNDLKSLPALKTEIQQKVNEQAQKQYEQQQERQRLYREKFLEEQERQRQKLLEQMKQRKEQQEKQIEQQLERQRKLQQLYQQQLEQQLQEYQKMREQL